jgi:hypothetical protein
LEEQFQKTKIKNMKQFIYYNKPEYIKVSPINVSKHIDVDKLEDFMNKVEPAKNMSAFTKNNFKNEKVWDKMLNIISDYYIEILNVIDGKKLMKENIYSNEIFFIEALPNKLLKDIIIYFYYTYELPITVPLKTTHDNIMIHNYKSTENPHKSKVSKMKDKEFEYYKIEHKLDNYYKIFTDLGFTYQYPNASALASTDAKAHDSKSDWFVKSTKKIVDIKNA